MLPPYLPALALTLLLEVPLASAWLVRRADADTTAAIATSTGVSLVTHPILWFLWIGWSLWMGPHLAVLVFLEVLVVLAETTGYRLALNVPWSQAALVSASTNLLSAVLGGWIYETWFYSP